MKKTKSPATSSSSNLPALIPPPRRQKNAAPPTSCQSPLGYTKKKTNAHRADVFPFEKRRANASPCVCVCVCVCVFQRPDDDGINGVLTGYRLYYRELPVNTSTLAEAEVQATKNNTTSALITSESDWSSPELLMKPHSHLVTVAMRVRTFLMQHIRCLQSENESVLLH